MKRLFILASAAIVALAACTKTEVVYKDALEQIAFKQITHVMTKSESLAELDDELPLGVIAHYEEDVYFLNTEFAHDGTSSWTNTGKYWPYEGTLDFTVYAPYVEVATYSDNKLTISGIEASNDLYYGVTRYLGTSKQNTVPVVLNHACAKLIVDLSGVDDLYRVNSVQFDGVNTGGNVIVTYTSNSVSVSTGNNPTTSNEICFDGEDSSPVYVLPGNQTSFTISFTQENGNYDVDFTKTVELTDAVWSANTEYTYKIIINNPNCISFSAKVNEWTSTNPVDKTVQ